MRYIPTRKDQIDLIDQLINTELEATMEESRLGDERVKYLTRILTIAESIKQAIKDSITKN